MVISNTRDEFYSAGGPGLASPTLEPELEGPPNWGDQPPMYNERNIPIYDRGQLVGARPKGAPGAVMEGGQYLDPISMQNYANAARQADIYSRIKTRLDDQSNDLMEELERQYEVQYEAMRNKYARDDNDLMGQMKKGQITPEAYKFLSESAQNAFREGEMKLRAGKEETIAKWRFLEKDAAKLIEKGEAPDLVGRVTEQKKAKMINFDLPGLVRGELDREAALADFDARVARGEKPHQAAYLANVPQAVAGGGGGQVSLNQLGGLEDSIEGTYDSIFETMPGAMATGQFGIKTPASDFKPSAADQEKVGQSIDAWAEYIHSVTGTPKPTLTEIARTRLNMRYPNFSAQTGQGAPDVNDVAGAQTDNAASIFTIFPNLPPHIQAKIKQALSLGVPMEKLMTSPDLQPYLAK